MSGIFGLIDPSGADAQVVVRAARSAPRRGEPTVWADGPVVIGHYREDAGWSSLAVTEAAVVAIDGRVDAALPRTQAARLERDTTGHELLALVLGTVGGRGLAQLAAEFAVARYDRVARTLLLSREAFGMRPLFWAREGRRVGFATDPEVLLALGFGSGELDRSRVTAYLALCDWGGEQTAFVGVKRVKTGWFLEFCTNAVIKEERWFRPEDVPQHDWTLENATEALRFELGRAIGDRARGRRTALRLSGGRDSGAVAVTAAAVGVRPTCLTQTYDQTTYCDEHEAAFALTRAVGLECRGVRLTQPPSERDLLDLPLISGTPLANPHFNEPAAWSKAIAECGAEVVLDGDGGDVWFSVGPVSIAAALLRARPDKAWRIAQAFDKAGRYGRKGMVHYLAALALPVPMLERRAARRRRDPAWLVGGLPAEVTGLDLPRTPRAEILSLARSWDVDPVAELSERDALPAGARESCPMLDLRVVQLGLSLPWELRAPIPRYKPLLAAILGPYDASRRKTRFGQYYTALGEAATRSFRSWIRPDMLLAQEGYVDGGRLAADARCVPGMAMLRCLAVESWLRSRGG